MRREGVVLTLAVGTLVVGGWLSSGGGPALASEAALAAGAAPTRQEVFGERVADLRNTDPQVRLAAVRALGASGTPQAIVPLSGLLTDPVDEIQFEVIQQLLGFYLVEPPRASRRVALVVEVRKDVDAAAAFEEGPFIVLPRPSPPELVAGLAGAMRDQNPSVRLQATYALGVMARPPLEPVGAEVLTAALRDSSADMRVAAARVLGALRVATAGEALVSAVNDEEKAVRIAAMRALGDIREVRAVKALQEQLDFYKRGELAAAAYDGLARVAHASSIPLFQSWLPSRDPLGRRYAAEGLARTGDLQAAASVEPFFDKEKDRQVRAAMAFALVVAGRPATSVLVEALADEDLAPQVMAYLVELGQPVVPQITGSLRAEHPKVRERTAMVLGLVGGADALAALEQLPPDDNLDVARAVERGIARLRLPAP